MDLPQVTQWDKDSNPYLGSGSAVSPGAPGRSQGANEGAVLGSQEEGPGWALEDEP